MQYGKVFVPVLAVLALAGCGGSGGGVLAQQSPRVRLFNGADGESTVYATFQDANLNNLGVSPNAAYGSATTDTIIADTTATATIMASTGPLVTTTPALFRENSYYTLYALGGAFQGYRGLVVTDSQLVAAGQTFGIRTVQLSTKNPNVDVYVVGGPIPLVSTTPLFTNVAYGTITSSSNTVGAVDSNGYVLQPISGTTSYNIGITAHGSTTSLATTASTVAQGSYYTAVVYDSPAGSTTQTSVVLLGDVRTQ